jgi:hypothetical protein
MASQDMAAQDQPAERPVAAAPTPDSVPSDSTPALEKAAASDPTSERAPAKRRRRFANTRRLCRDLLAFFLPPLLLLPITAIVVTLGSGLLLLGSREAGDRPDCYRLGGGCRCAWQSCSVGQGGGEPGSRADPSPGHPAVELDPVAGCQEPTGDRQRGFAPGFGGPRQLFAHFKRCGTVAEANHHELPPSPVARVRSLLPHLTFSTRRCMPWMGSALPAHPDQWSRCIQV